MFYYVAKNYIGLSEWEQTQKAAAFVPEADQNRLMIGLQAQSTPISFFHFNKFFEFILFFSSRFNWPYQ